MKVEFKVPESDTEPRLWVQHEQVLAMVLRPGSIEWGLRRSEMQRVDYIAGDLELFHPMSRRGCGEDCGLSEWTAVSRFC